MQILDPSGSTCLCGMGCKLKMTLNKEESLVIEVFLWELIPVRSMNWRDCFSVAWDDKVLTN